MQTQRWRVTETLRLKCGGRKQKGWPALDVISSPSWTKCLDEFCGTDVSVCAVRVIVPVYSFCHQHPGHSVFAWEILFESFHKMGIILILTSDKI